MNRRRLHDLINFPWIHGPRWRRAYRVAAIRNQRLCEEHIAWAQHLRTTTVAFCNTPRREGR